MWGQTPSTLEEQGQRSQWQRPVSCRIPSLSRVQALAALPGGGQLMPSLAGWPSRAIRGEEAHPGARFLACLSSLWEALAGDSERWPRSLCCLCHLSTTPASSGCEQPWGMQATGCRGYRGVWRRAGPGQCSQACSSSGFLSNLLGWTVN